MRGALLPKAAVVAALALALTVCAEAVRPVAEAAAEKPRGDDKDAAKEAADDIAGEGFLDPMGPNAACYVCHVTFVDEPLAVEHLRAKTTCIDCHGTSQGHANDENIGATPPDIVIQRPQVNCACRKCHQGHDVRPEDVIARWIERARFRSRSARPAKGPLQPQVVCTDCHGSHRVSRAQAERAPQTK
jgi:hypothetical protein